MKRWWGYLKETVHEFSKDKSPRLAAALAYYTLFSIAPLLVIAIAIAGWVFGPAAAEGKIVGELSQFLGPRAASGIQNMIKGASDQPTQGLIGTIIGVVVLLFGASGVVTHLQESLNAIWNVPESQSSGILGTIWRRLWSLAMVLAIGFLLLVSLLLSAAISALGTWFQQAVGVPQWVWFMANIVISFGVITLLFALLYKVIPEADIEWSDVWGGAVFTSLLFIVGKFLIGLYLGQSSVASSYGAAGSIVIVLIWLYYSGLILFFGAEFTEVWARHRHGLGSREERGLSGLGRATPGPPRR
ncbi:MAG: YihY/virulence factor BrkB family protein [Thermoanaerobaculia bacterium]